MLLQNDRDQQEIFSSQAIFTRMFRLVINNNWQDFVDMRDFEFMCMCVSLIQLIADVQAASIWRDSAAESESCHKPGAKGPMQGASHQEDLLIVLSSFSLFIILD